MSDMTYPGLRLERHGRTAVVTLANPPAHTWTADSLAGLDIETDIGHGKHLGIFACHQRLEGAEETRKSPVLPEALADAPGLDQSRHVYFPRE